MSIAFRRLALLGWALALAGQAHAQSGGAGVTPTTRETRQAKTATAGTSAASAPHALVWVDVGYRPVTSAFESTVEFTRYAEQGSVTTPYPTTGGLVAGGGAGARVWRGLVVGGAGSWFSTSGTALVTARIPHPFFFDTPREVQGQSPTLARREAAVHAFAMWILPLGSSVRLGLMGGPSHFSVRQELVTDVEVNDTYPYDNATFASARTSEKTGSGTGFNVGVDVTYLLGRRVGVGATIRYSRATIEFDLANGQGVSSKAGGAEVGGGVRLRF